MALALSLPDSFAYKEMITITTFGVVLFTLLVPGLTIEPLVTLLKMNAKDPKREQYKMLKAKLAPAPATEPEQQLFAFVRRLEAMKAELKSIPASDPKRQNLMARVNMMTSFVQAVTLPAPPDIRLRVLYGFEVESLTGQLMNYFAVTNGLLITSVADKDKAARSGLQAGDVVVKVGDQQITNLPSLVNALDNSKGDTIDITVSRRREPVKISLLR